MTSTLPPHYASPRTPFWQLAVIWLLLPILVLVALLARFELAYSERIYPGVQALGVDLSGKTRDDARQLLSAAANNYDLPPLALRHGDQMWPLKAEELGLSIDTDELVNQAFAVGRQGTAADNFAAQWQAYWQGRQQRPQINVQPGAITTAIGERTAQLNQAVTEPKLLLNDLQVVVTASRPGQMVDVETTREEVISRIESGRGGVVDVVVHELSTAEADVSAGQASIRQLLEHSIVLADPLGEFQFALDPATLSGMLEWVHDENTPGGLRGVVQEDKLRDLIETWSLQVDRPPLDARFDFSTTMNTLVELSPSVDGYELNTDAAVTAILDAIETGKTQIELPVEVVRPEVASDDAASLGITELVAEGTTRFKGSSADRVKNIEVASSKFVGVVIPPGGVFSFIEHVGDVTAANGFEDSLIIAGDRTAVGVGGGVCQVSTTVFRTAWFGGFPIEERWNHGYVVSWYGEPGLDATIYTPTVDFKFRNTTGHYLLIKPVVNTEQGILKFQFYGTKPGWEVTAPKPKITDRVAPPPPLYIEDPKLPAGKVVQFDWAVEGLNAQAKRKVTAADGTVLIDETMKSKYRPWQAKFRFGPGFQPPANAEVKWANQ
jgi:vancomycin resistance protein YoaR